MNTGQKACIITLSFRAMPWATVIQTLFTPNFFMVLPSRLSHHVPWGFLERFTHSLTQWVQIKLQSQKMGFMAEWNRNGLASKESISTGLDSKVKCNIMNKREVGGAWRRSGTEILSYRRKEIRVGLGAKRCLSYDLITISREGS